MTAIAQGASTPEQRERIFFLFMAFAIIATVLGAFGVYFLRGMSSFDAPWWVHIHAVSFTGWIIFYAVQNWLIFSNRLSSHRKLGRLGAGLAVWMVVVGLLLTGLALSAGRVPPIFSPAYFLAMDWLNILIFAAVFAFAIKKVKQTDWHRRLMLCATIILLPPAFGRINFMLLSDLPPPPIGPATIQALELSLYILAAMAFDRFNRGRVHPAYYWSLGALFLFAAGTQLLSSFGPFAALANSIAP